MGKFEQTSRVVVVVVVVIVVVVYKEKAPIRFDRFRLVQARSLYE